MGHNKASRSDRNGTWLVLALLIVAGASLALVLIPARARVAASDLPPRPATPTPQPTNQPLPKPESESSPVGAYIELQVQTSIGEPSAGWQELWTVVQWQDFQGRWHDVEGWRGGLDSAPGKVGHKTWWLADNLFEQGPFRWLVAEGEGGPALVFSESFHLPGTAKQTLQIEVLLIP